MKLLVTAIALLVVPLLCLCQSTGPSYGNFPSNFIVTVQGEAVDSSYAFNLVNNTGTLTIRGVQYTALAYWTQVMDTFGGDGVWWINIVGVAEDGSNLAIVYLDCTNNQLQNAFWEEDWQTFLFVQDIQKQYLNQNCHFQLGNFSIPVQFPSLDAIPTSSFSTGITITGDQISLNDNAGWFIYNNDNFTVYPISTVNCWNCKSNCGNYQGTAPPTDTEYCPPGPWYEIHHAAVNGDTICFGIFYLFRENPTFVQWNYTFCLPEANSPMVLFQADWTGVLQGQNLENLHRFGGRPPVLEGGIANPFAGSKAAEPVRNSQDDLPNKMRAILNRFGR